MDYLVKMKGITKKFPGVLALDNINFDLKSGEVHVILGENGAGKSTLMKILSGVYQPDEGTIIINDKEYSSLTPKKSSEYGIEIIYQELSCIDELSIYENIFVGKLLTKKVLGKKFIDIKAMKAKARELLDIVGLNVKTTLIMEELSVSQKQLVEIAKALSANAKVIIMDEPTSSLTIEESRNLFKIIKDLKAKGIGIIYISHKLGEIKQIGDRVTVLKDGKYVATKNVAETEIEQMINLMVGRELKSKYMQGIKELKKFDKVLLKVEDFTRLDNKVKNVNFELYEGEILGFAGLIGAGRTELMSALFGADKAKGKVWFDGKEYKVKNTYQAIKQNIAMLTESRRQTGIFQNFEVWRNISSGWLIKKSKGKGLIGLTNVNEERKIAKKYEKALNIKCSSIDQNITDLSGGNQQKAIVGKWLAANAKIFIFDEPTRGIDVGTKSDIYNIMNSLTQEGKSIMMVSSELPELLLVCDRIIVFREGEISAVITCDEATEQKIMTAAAKY